MKTGSDGRCYVGDETSRQSVVGLMQRKPFSPPILDALIEAVSDKTTLHVSTYMSRGPMHSGN